MKYNYEINCKKAQLKETHTSRIRKALDAPRKNMKSQSAVIQENRYSRISIHADDKTKALVYSIPDENTDVEEEVMHDILLEQLMGLLDELDEEERINVLNYVDPDVNFSAYADSVGKDRETLRRYAQDTINNLQDVMVHNKKILKKSNKFRELCISDSLEKAEG